MGRKWLPAVTTWMVACLACDVSLAQQSVSDALFNDWNFQGANTLRIDNYSASGATAATPYPFEGLQAYDEIGISFNRNNGPYSKWRGQIFGVVNGNDYRSVDDDLVPERLNLTHETGESTIPYRWELGDYFSYFSYMTQQRSLKGFQLELQPAFSDRADSIILFGGANEANWQDFTLNEDFSGGLSYLLPSQSWGVWSFNAVINHRESNARQAQPDRNQNVVSVAFARDLALNSNQLEFEGEYAHFSGDHNGAIGAPTGEDRSANGYFLEMRGLSLDKPLDYRLRAELYERDFLPRGAVVTADRRSLEGHAGWRFDSGLRLRARLQGFDDAYQSGNKLETRTAGLNWSGPFFRNQLPGLNGNIDIYFQTRENDNATIDQSLLNLSADFSKDVGYGWYGRLGVFIQELDDKTPALFDRDTWQVDFSADHEFNLGPFTGIITPGMLFRLLRDGVAADGDEFQPTLAFQLAHQQHSVAFNYGVLVQDRFGTGTTDVDTHTIATNYRYQHKQHTFGVELNIFDRLPDPGEDSEAWNLGVFWTYNFERRRARPDIATPSRRTIDEPVPLPQAVDISAVDVSQLAPGLAFGATRERLVELGLEGASRLGDTDVYEYQVLRRIEQRQRLLLMHRGGQLTMSAVIIEFDDIGNVDSVSQTFERVRKALIDRYGNPANMLEEGEFTTSFTLDVNAQRFVRVIEWSTASGVLRFGIPRRLDGRVRMELQHRTTFPQMRDTLWSVEKVR